ncbi:type II secretion system secretin GspD [Aestuariicella hydrocarbonica]|uniref:Type II secretion system secretin GspD n=1 Tax=Pseudomaricurvus hydrocarbonicus TaxID=1470433 RepID=A0A9E5MJF5_9GAMM|nr:type II secretion system secretin GspD [Aestuariicella hydrocarbonica]NHO63937.1 type II secretion system secretin GspD [Aestuariicella hydrocarbonica]
MQHRYGIITVIFSTFLFGAEGVYSQTLPKPPDDQAKITLALDHADILDLIQWAREVTHKSIIVHPNVKGKVTVLSGSPMTTGEAYEVFLSALQVHGFAIVESGNALKIIPDALAKQSSVPVINNGPDNKTPPEEVVVKVVKVKNISATQLVNLLRPLVPQVGHLAAYPTTNALIIADRANNISKITGIIKRLDTGNTVDIELLPLEFASAKDVANVINKLLPQPQGKKEEVSTVQLAVDERSNSLLLTGDIATRSQIRKLVQRLDQPLTGDGNTQVFYLNYSNAAELVPILESTAGSLKKNQKDQGAMTTEIGIQASEALNALVITAPPAMLNTMKGVIAKLDRRRAQVLVEALIVEVGEELGKDLGVEWMAHNSDTSLGFRSFPLTPKLNIDQDGNLGTLGSGFSFGYFRGGDMRALINALATESNANILSTPTIMALDNEEARILVGENVPFITGSEARANDDPFQTIERQDVGITLKVKPRVNNNNSVTLEIEQSVESIRDSTDVNASDIITSKREIKTRVLVDNEQTLVLGGLIRDEVQETENKVPILGSIPVLGRLFKSTSSNTIKRNLMVFIQPTILNDSAASFEVTRERYERIRSEQGAFRERVDSFFVPNPIPQLPEITAPKPSQPPGVIIRAKSKADAPDAPDP